MNKNKIFLICVFVITGMLCLVCAGLVVYNNIPFKVNAIVYPEVISVNSDIQGVVKEVFVNNDQEVKKGQILAEIEYSDGNDMSEKVSSQDKILSSAKVELDNAKNDYQNSVSMYKDGVISQEQYDKALNRLTFAQNNYKSALAKSVALKNNAKNTTKIKQIVANQDAYVDSIKVNSGFKTDVDTQLMILSSKGEPQITAYVSENKVKKIKENNEVKIKINSFKDKVFKGNILVVSDRAYSVDGYDTPVYIVQIKFTDDISAFPLERGAEVSVTF